MFIIFLNAKKFKTRKMALTIQFNYHYYCLYFLVNPVILFDII